MHIRLALLMFVEKRWEGDLYMLNFFLWPTHYRFLMGNKIRLLKYFESIVRGVTTGLGLTKLNGTVHDALFALP